MWKHNITFKCCVRLKQGKSINFKKILPNVLTAARLLFAALSYLLPHGCPRSFSALAFGSVHLMIVSRVRHCQFGLWIHTNVFKSACTFVQCANDREFNLTRTENRGSTPCAILLLTNH